MSNIISFADAKGKKEDKVTELAEIDRIFRVMSSKEEREFLLRVKAHFTNLGEKLVSTSKYIPKEVLRFKSLFSMKKRIGFSLSLNKVRKFDDGWVLYPIKAKSERDYLTVVNHMSDKLMEKGDVNE